MADNKPWEPANEKEERRSRKMKAQIAVLNRERVLLQELALGKTVYEAGLKVGIHDKSNARRMRDRALKRIIQEPAQDVLATELAKLNLIEKLMWGPAAQLSSTDHVDRILAVMERRARYLGLYGMTKPDPSADARAALIGFATAAQAMIESLDGDRSVEDEYDSPVAETPADA